MVVKIILNWVIMKLNLLMFFFLFCFETPLKDFPFYSLIPLKDFPFYYLILLTLCFIYLQIWIRKVLCTFLVNFSSKLPMKLQDSRKHPRKMHFPTICRPKFKKIFPSVSTMGPSHRAIELSKQQRNWVFGGKWL